MAVFVVGQYGVKTKELAAVKEMVFEASGAIVPVLIIGLLKSRPPWYVVLALTLNVMSTMSAFVTLSVVTSAELSSAFTVNLSVLETDTGEPEVAVDGVFGVVIVVLVTVVVVVVLTGVADPPCIDQTTAPTMIRIIMTRMMIPVFDMFI